MPTQIQPHLGLPAPTQWALKAGRGCHSWAPRSQAHPGVPLTSSISPYPSGTRVGSHGRPAGRSSRQSRAGRSGTDRATPWLLRPRPARAVMGPVPRCSAPAGSGRTGLFYRDGLAFRGCGAPPQSSTCPLSGKSSGGNLLPLRILLTGVRTPVPGLPCPA